MERCKTLEKQINMKDWTFRQDMEMTMRVNAEADINRLRGFKESLALSTGDLKLQHEGLKEELAYMKSNHEEVGLAWNHVTIITETRHVAVDFLKLVVLLWLHLVETSN